MLFGSGFCQNILSRPSRTPLGLYPPNPRHLRHLMETSSVRVSLSSASQPYRRRSFSPMGRSRSRSRSGPGLSRRFVLYTLIALCILIILGFVSTVVGGLYLSRIVGPSEEGHVDNVNQLLCILAIICGMIMLLSSSVLLRALLCKRSGGCFGGQRPSASQFSGTITGESGRRSAASLASHNNTDVHSAPHPSSEESDSPVGLPSPLFMPSFPACPPPYMPNPTPISLGGYNTVQRDHVTGMILPPKYSAEPPPSYSVLELERLGVDGIRRDEDDDESDTEKPVSIWTRQGSV